MSRNYRSLTRVAAQPIRTPRLTRTNPETKEKAPKGQHWVRSAMNRAWVLECDGTPFTCSVASETYWCS